MKKLVEWVDVARPPRRWQCEATEYDKRAAREACSTEFGTFETCSNSAKHMVQNGAPPRVRWAMFYNLGMTAMPKSNFCPQVTWTYLYTRPLFTPSVHLMGFGVNGSLSVFQMQVATTYS